MGIGVAGGSGVHHDIGRSELPKLTALEAAHPDHIGYWTTSHDPAPMRLLRYWLFQAVGHPRQAGFRIALDG